MPRLLSLFLFLLHARDVVSANCTTGYIDIGNGICRSDIRSATPQYKAYAYCAASNAYMPTVNNAFENSKIASLNGEAQWLGLTCTSSDRTSCLWDNGVSITNTSYSNFAPGHPNMATGACVYLNVPSGQWYSSDCTQTSVYYVCQTSPGVYVSQCPPPTSYFRGYCYYPLYALGYSKAVLSCTNNCGNLVSIHNDGENSYVRDIAVSNSTGAVYSYIGLSYTNGSYQWDDGTRMNFDKFGFKNSELGFCVLMGTANGDIVSRGQWTSADCSEDITAVCKTGLTCQTDTPPQCAETQYLSGSGELLSPGYPRGSDAGHCQYIITEDSGSTVVLIVEELSLDSSSTIKVYNSPTDTVPFVTFGSSTEPSNVTAYFGAANFLKIVYETPTINVFNGFRNHWRIKYDSHPIAADHCSSTFTTSPSVISGPHLALNCTYVLRMGAVTTRTCLRFTSVNVKPGDSITIYDGPISSENLIGFLASVIVNPYATTVALCSTTSNYMTVVTTGRSGLNYEMFVLTAADSPAVLNPTELHFSYSSKLVPVTDSRGYPTGSTLYYPSDNSKTRVQVDFSYFTAPDPNYIVIMDGQNKTQNFTVALAYGSLPSSSRKTYQSSQRYLLIASIYSPGGTSSTQYTGSFTAL